MLVSCTQIWNKLRLRIPIFIRSGLVLLGFFLVVFRFFGFFGGVFVFPDGNFGFLNGNSTFPRFLGQSAGLLVLDYFSPLPGDGMLLTAEGAPPFVFRRISAVSCQLPIDSAFPWAPLPGV